VPNQRIARHVAYLLAFLVQVSLVLVSPTGAVARKNSLVGLSIVNATVSGIAAREAGERQDHLPLLIGAVSVPMGNTLARCYLG
jgi:hypothetical protein